MTLVYWLPKGDKCPVIGMSRIRSVGQLPYAFRGQKPMNGVYFYMWPLSVSAQCCVPNTTGLKCEGAVRLGANGIAVCPQEGIGIGIGRMRVLNWFVFNCKAVNKDHSSVNSAPFGCHSAMSPSVLFTVVVLKGRQL
jgi:hypothetical protein